MKKALVVLVVLLFAVTFTGCEALLSLIGLGGGNAMPTPVFAPPEGEYDSAQDVSIACSDVDAIIFYTLDGTTPSAGSERFVDPININTSLTIKAIAIKAGTPDSEVASANYIINIPDTTGVMMLLSGDVNDGWYNEQARDALLQAGIDNDIPVDFLVSAETDYTAELSAMAENGADLVIGSGFMFVDAIQNAAASHPDTKFVVIDAYIDAGTATPNAAGLVFDIKQSGYLAGIAAAYATTSEVIGGVFGLDIDGVRGFFYGFYAGAKTVSPAITVLPPIITGSFDDPVQGKLDAENLISQGADVIFALGGGSSIGVFEAAEEAASTVLAIGADTDQNHLFTDTILTSALKYTGAMVTYAVNGFLANSLPEAANWRIGITDGATGIAPYHSFDAGISQEQRDVIDAAINDMHFDTLGIPIPWSLNRIVKIGLAAPLTGGLELYGTTAYRAMRMLVLDRNSGGGILAKFISLEVRNDDGDAVGAATYLRDFGVSGV
ncbi:MAG: BMP family ABC transporter substrate-binding protein, partial [Spirochaetales bacterium]|nr:BMP family ABC transporter substrate-binding protein [Spirochaetales bacterium]